MNTRTWWNSLADRFSLDALVTGLLASEFLAGTSLLMLSELDDREAPVAADELAAGAPERRTDA